MAGERPGVVLSSPSSPWIHIPIGIVTGIIARFLLGDAGTAEWIDLALGVPTLPVGIGLLRGRNVARVIATIVFGTEHREHLDPGPHPGRSAGTNIWSALGT